MSDTPGDVSTFQIREGLIGQVATSDGMPVAGALIEPRATRDGSGPIPDIAIVTDQGGRYAWPLRAGTYDVRVMADGYVDSHRDVTIRQGELVNLHFTLEQRPRQSN